MRCRRAITYNECGREACRPDNRGSENIGSNNRGSVGPSAGTARCVTSARVLLRAFFITSVIAFSLSKIDDLYRNFVA